MYEQEKLFGIYLSWVLMLMPLVRFMEALEAPGMHQPIVTVSFWSRYLWCAKIGVPAAIQVARELGDKVRTKAFIDSGDIAYILKSRQRRVEAGFTQKLRSMLLMIPMKIPSLTSKMQHRLMSGVGTKLITAMISQIGRL